MDTPPTEGPPTPGAMEGGTQDPAALAPTGTAGQSTALAVRLAPRGAALPSTFGGPAFEAALDASTGSRARAGCSTRLLFDGQQSFRERNALIAAATSSIHLQSFIFTDDHAGWEMARGLAAKAREGVSVRVIVDAFGSQRTDPALFEMLREAGAEVRMHETGLVGMNMRWHEKHLIVDGRVSIEGGMNIADEYALGGSGVRIFSKYKKGELPWRDVDVKIEGAAVHDAQRAFLRNWALLGDKVADLKGLFPRPGFRPGGPTVRMVQHHPTAGDDYTMQLHLHAVRAATQSITIENAYFIPPPALREALCEAARRGVEVRVLTNSKESGNHGYCVDAARYWYDEMLRAGVKIYERSERSTLHAKTVAVDGTFSIVGSANLNGRSDGLDTECAAAISDAHTARQLEQRFEEGVVEARQITLEELAKDSFVARLRQWGFASLSWTL